MICRKLDTVANLFAAQGHNPEPKRFPSFLNSGEFFAAIRLRSRRYDNRLAGFRIAASLIQAVRMVRACPAAGLSDDRAC